MAPGKPPPAEQVSADDLDFDRFYNLVGGTHICEVCSNDHWARLAPSVGWNRSEPAPEYLYLGTREDSGRSKDILYFPIAGLACTRCGNLRLHLRTFVQEVLANADDEKA